MIKVFTYLYYLGITQIYQSAFLLLIKRYSFFFFFARFEELLDNWPNYVFIT